VSRVHIEFDERGEVAAYQLLALSWGRLSALRSAAAVALAPRLEVAEALLAGVAVPARRLDPAWVQALALASDVVLDVELAFRVSGHGRIEVTA
jgi:hypothetical protein